MPSSEKSRQKSDNDALRVLKAFRNLVKALRVADRAAVKAHGLGSAQIYVMHQLSDQAPLSINELAEITGTDQSTVSVVVAKLVARGLVSSSRAGDDQRRVELELTTAGKKTLRGLPTPFAEAFLEALGALPPAGVRSLANQFEAVLETMGIAEENPPMLLADGVEDKAPRTAKKSTKKKTAARPAARRKPATRRS